MDLLGKLAEHARRVPGQGQAVNVIGRLQNNNYAGADGGLVYGLTFTCEAIDYLDSRVEAEVRRSRQGRELQQRDRSHRRCPGPRRPANARRLGADNGRRAVKTARAEKAGVARHASLHLDEHDFDR